MKYKLRVIHAASGKVFEGDSYEAYDGKKEEIEDFICNSIPHLNHLSAGGVILPGDFVRNHCYFEIVAEE